MMHRRTVMAFGVFLLAVPLMNGYAFADASYESTTQITGGSLADTMKSVSFLSKSMRNMFAPISTLTIVHGNQKAVVTKESTEIIDLDKEEMIHIDTMKKTYSVVTFAQMREAMQQLPEQMQKMQAQSKQAQAQPMPKTDLKTSFDVKVNNTGVSKVVNGLMAQEQIVTLTMTVTDPDAAAAQANGASPANGTPPASGTTAAAGTGPSGPASISYTVTTDAWIAPDPPEVKEIADFDVKMGKKMMEGVDMQAFVAQMRAGVNNMGMSQLLGGQPGATDAMAQMAKEMAKIQGTRVLEVTSMGGMAPTQGTGNAASASTPSSTGQRTSDTAAQTANQSSGLGALGSALGGSMLGGWHKKKASTPPPADPATAPAAGAPASGDGTQNVVLMSMTTQKLNFSEGPVDTSAFEIPAGFTKVPSPYEQQLNQKQ